MQNFNEGQSGLNIMRAQMKEITETYSAIYAHIVQKVPVFTIEVEYRFPDASINVTERTISPWYHNLYLD